MTANEPWDGTWRKGRRKRRRTKMRRRTIGRKQCEEKYQRM
jgi:hypothetical protein